MTTLPYAEGADPKAERVTPDLVRKVAVMPAYLTIVCLWSLTGLILTGLIAVYVGSVDFAAFLAPAG